MSALEPLVRIMDSDGSVNIFASNQHMTFGRPWILSELYYSLGGSTTEAKAIAMTVMYFFSVYSLQFSPSILDD